MTSPNPHALTSAGTAARGSRLASGVAARTVAPARRVAPRSARRRASTLVLVVGSVLAIASTVGPGWVKIGGIAIALIAAVLACALAWRELWHTRRQHAKQVLEMTKDHGVQLREERTRNASVVDTLRARVSEHVTVIEGQRVTIAQLRGQVSALRGDYAFLQSELEQREFTIGSLRDSIRAREAEVRALLTADGEGDAQVHALPRRVFAERPADETGSSVTTLDFTASESKVLPNFEGVA